MTRSHRRCVRTYDPKTRPAIQVCRASTRLRADGPIHVSVGTVHHAACRMQRECVTGRPEPRPAIHCICCIALNAAGESALVLFILEVSGLRVGVVSTGITSNGFAETHSGSGV
eukprot:5638937-Prymnesium_polylepis.1